MLSRNLKVPTGNICTIKGELNKELEFVSIGDYGKNANIKANFLGITKELNGVPNGDILPLSEKWVITISTQYGCSMNCKFCDVPKVGPGINATYQDMVNQIYAALSLHPEVTKTNRLNIHFARMGEPTWNRHVLDVALDLLCIAYNKKLNAKTIHPVVSTMMPMYNNKLMRFITKWANMKNIGFKGEAGLQFSINSTNEQQRIDMFSGKAITLKNIAYLAERLPIPIGRKYTLNFALADGYEIDAKLLKSLFNPNHFMVKITPLHRTTSCSDNNIITTGGMDNFVPYKDAERDLINEGFDVIIFVPSYDEDDGLITCGNAILSGKLPSCKYEDLNK